MTKLPIYEEGLDFHCTGCGKCCTGAPGYIWINHNEMQKIAEHLGISLRDFQKKYTKQKNGRYSLIDKKPDYDCIFLKGKECSIYHLRPMQCRTFPWWPENLRSNETWEELGKTCEGVNHKANHVSKDEISSELKKHKQYMKDL